ncbi:MAG: FAD-dependent monooxygenase [Acidobacteria bacterium]|nr:MAG: FAD-dependent monooxygenase [Acidobacteriota bacterium]REK02072.1 MAG: FAD-dependent monooxygenase [Acidobacteriota bacterium]REK15030.1 MAG: FAD-dependent monooxygenase [Acidobacteriota bacterium]REK45744.1 MAG: FAD-dependent monooxygenase [Acidobacteriota bacterium]
MSEQKVIIVGAGLAGSLLSIYLAKRGIEVEVYEARPDMRSTEMSAGRSINLALSDRGIKALNEVGMDEYMLREAIPMYGRLVHDVEGNTKMLPYSGREGEFINSVSRGGLNLALINEADNYRESRFYFERRCIDFDCRSGEVLIRNERTGEEHEVFGSTVIATDGAGSAVRRAMMNGGVPRFNYSQDFLEHGYKELSIPPGVDGTFQMEKNALHIWARRSFMMIALPNFDGSYTCTLFLAHKGENSFESIDSGAYPSARPNGKEGSSSAALIRFFEDHFADSIPLIGNLEHEYFTNPTGDLGTVKCFPWYAGDKALLLGDSAHAVVPFYGQGMNASFEDCRIFDELIDRHGTDWGLVFEEYSEVRKENTDAIADMAVENFYEMRDAVADPVFQRKRELETRLEQEHPDYFSKYSLVTFREDVPYSEAMRRGNAQDRLLMEICAREPETAAIDTEQVLAEIKALAI